MTNYEKNKDEIIELLAKGCTVAVNKKNKITVCGNCEDCLFDDDYSDCYDRKVAWFNSEYIEPPVDWSKVEVDTPVLVSHDNVVYYKRHFAKYKNGRVFVWGYGRTSWSAIDEDDIAWYTYAKLAEKE